MSIGSVYYFDYKLTSGLSEILEAWEDTLETNDDDFTVIDNEEGDYGIIRYLDSNGVEMLTKVVQAGDIENTYFTDAGADAVREMMLANFNDILGAALTAGMPTAGDLKAHEPRKLKICNLHTETFPDKLGSFDLYQLDGNYFMPFADKDNPTQYLFWCHDADEYLRADRKLYATAEVWCECIANHTMTVGVHKKGLQDLTRINKERESL